MREQILKLIITSLDDLTKTFINSYYNLAQLEHMSFYQLKWYS